MLQRVRDVHYDTPHPISLLPNPHVAALLGYVLRIVRHFVRPMRVTEITGARNVAADRLPLDRAYSIRQRVSRGLNADVWKIARTIKPDVTRSIDRIKIFQHFSFFLFASLC